MFVVPVNRCPNPTRDGFIALIGGSPNGAGIVPSDRGESGGNYSSSVACSAAASDNHEISHGAPSKVKGARRVLAVLSPIGMSACDKRGPLLQPPIRNIPMHEDILCQRRQSRTLTEKRLAA